MATCSEDAGSGHGPLAVSAHHRDRAVGNCGVRDLTEFDVSRSGHVAGGVLVGLADVDDRAGQVGGADQRKGGGRQSGGGPGGNAAVELAE